MDPLLRSAKRDAKEALREAKILLRRGRKVLANEKKQAVEEAIDELQRCEGPSADVRKKTRTLQNLVDEHLSFARKGKAREYIESIGFAVIVALTIRAFIFEPFKIPSPSMVPTLEVGDRLYVSKARYGVRIPFTSKYLFQWRQPELGDIVVFEFPRREALTRDRIGQWMQHLATMDTPLPSTLEDVRKSTPRSINRMELFEDAWGTPLKYNVNPDGESYLLRSAGPDRQWDTSDDISNETVEPSFVAFPDFRRPDDLPRLSRCPVDPDSLQTPKAYIKRIMGLPGDTVEIKNNDFYINGKMLSKTVLSKGQPQATRAGTLVPTLNEETLPDGGPTYVTRTLFEDENYGPIVVPEGQFFAIGDNRDESSDARCWGFSSIESIRGQAKFVLFSVSPSTGFDGSRFLSPLK